MLLDEPSLGLDVQSRHRVWEYIRGLQADGVTILLATNYLDEADRLCDRITIIDEGRAVVSGTPVELKRGVGADVVQVATGAPQRLRAAIAAQPWVKEIADVDSGDVHIYVEDASVAMPALMRLCVEQRIELTRM